MASISAFRKIVEEKQYSRIEGHLVDLFSASAVCKVYDNLGDPDNRIKLMSLPIPRLITTAFKVLRRVK